MITRNFQRSGPPLQTPVLTPQGFAVPEWASFFNPLADLVGYGPTINDTHANRIALDGGHNLFYPPGRFLNYLFYETDRKVLYLAMLVAGVATWVFLGGEPMFGTLATIPAGLGTADAGFLFGATDYYHMYRWTGAAWDFAPGDSGSGFIVAAIASLLGALWAPCDGGSYAVAKPDGTTVNVNTPDLTGDIFIQGGAYTGTRKAAAPATWDGAAKTGGQSNHHTHSVNIPSSNSFAAGAFPAATGGVVGTSNESADHTHALTDGDAILNAPSEGAGGVPLRMNLAWFLRR